MNISNLLQIQDVYNSNFGSFCKRKLSVQMFCEVYSWFLKYGEDNIKGQ